VGKIIVIDFFYETIKEPREGKYKINLIYEFSDTWWEVS
jgi:hypothetical protein